MPGPPQLPPRIWTYPPEQILSATIVFYVWQDNSGTRDVSLYPLTRVFVQGTGTGTAPADGATWLTRDGTIPWSNPGGDFDPACPVVGVKGDILDPDLNDRFFYWDITALLKNTTSRTELQSYGALLRMDETPAPATGSPRAPFTSSYDPSYTPAYWPTLQFTIAPTLANVSVSGGAISFAISNLTVGATNTIERSFNLASNGWTPSFLLCRRQHLNQLVGNSGARMDQGLLSPPQPGMNARPYRRQRVPGATI